VTPFSKFQVLGGKKHRSSQPLNCCRPGPTVGPRMGSYRGSGTAAYTREEVLSGAVYAFRVVLESVGLGVWPTSGASWSHGAAGRQWAMVCMLLGARTQDILVYTQVGSLDTPQREIYLELSCFSTARCLFLRRRPGKIQSASTRSRNTPDLSAMNREVHAVRPISQFLFLCPSHFSKVVVLLPFSLYTPICWTMNVLLKEV